MNKEQHDLSRAIVDKLGSVSKSLKAGLSFTQKSDLKSRLSAIQEEINHYGLTYGHDSMYDQMQQTSHQAFVALEPAIAECI